MDQGLLTLKEAARYLKVGESTLRQGLRAGWDLKVVKLRSRCTKKAGRVKAFIRFRKADLDTWIDSQVTTMKEEEAA